MRKGRQDIESQRTKQQEEIELLKLKSRQLDEQLEEANKRAQSDAQKEKERQQLQSDLAQADAAHKKKMQELQDNFRRQSLELSASSSLARVSPRDSNRFSDAGPHESEAGFPLVPAPDKADMLQESDHRVCWRQKIEQEEQRALAARAEAQGCHKQMSELQASTTAELASLAEVRQELLQRRQAEEQQNEVKLAELQETERNCEKFQEDQDALEREAKDLQRQLSEAMYDVGKKDREQQLKESELTEVRQSINSIQDEMDAVNRQLQAQCSRVQRVEGSLRTSRDLGSKVQSIRDMLMESHAALGQLCGLVEHERSQKAECSQGLKQQQTRTELLLQLLSHFKSRTQDLAPQVLLSQANELAQAQMGTVPLVSGTVSPLVLEPTAAHLAHWSPPKSAVATVPHHLAGLPMAEHGAAEQGFQWPPQVGLQ